MESWLHRFTSFEYSAISTSSRLRADTFLYSSHWNAKIQSWAHFHGQVCPEQLSSSNRHPKPAPPLLLPPQPALRTAALGFNYCSPYIQVIDFLTPGWWAWGCSRLCFKWSLNHFIMEQLFLLHWLPACAGIVVSLQLSNLVLNSLGSFIICLFPRMPREGRNVNRSSHLWWKIKHCSYMDNLI